MKAMKILYSQNSFGTSLIWDTQLLIQVINEQNQKSKYNFFQFYKMGTIKRCDAVEGLGGIQRMNSRKPV